MPTVAAKSAASNASVFAPLLRHPLRLAFSSNPLVAVAAAIVLVVPFSRSLIDAELAGSLIIIIITLVVAR
jgi:hypothetical protein